MFLDAWLTACPSRPPIDPRRHRASRQPNFEGLERKELLTARPRLQDLADAPAVDRASEPEPSRQAPLQQHRVDRAQRREIVAPRRGHPLDRTLRGPASSGLGFQATPLTDLAGSYKGRDGGLYGGGQNEPPEPLASLAAEASAAIQPLDRRGRPSPSGAIGLLSIGQSTTSMYFSSFQRLARRDPNLSGRVRLVNGAISGMIAQRWVDPGGNWNVARGRLAASGLTPAQVQVIWLKAAHENPWQSGATITEQSTRYEAMLAQIIRNANRYFPNLKIVYVSSRVYAGYAPVTVSPEPFAYEEAFAVRQLIQRQQPGNLGPIADPTRGQARAPLILWGPYLWASAHTPRSDGLSWLPSDLPGDGVHPGPAGRLKIAARLLDFFSTNSTTKSWFTKQGAG